MKIWTFLLTLIGSCVICSPVMAHPHHPISASSGFMEGLSHPWFGLDHLLAMVAVGMLSVQMGERSIWMLPVSFLSCLTVGGILGLSGFGILNVELGIALSVVLLGTALMSQVRFPFVATVIGVGCMGVIHGHAHGTEMPMSAEPWLYMLGFSTATLLLHAGGILAGKWLSGNKTRLVGLKLSGAAISCAGIVLLLRVI